MQGKYHLCKGLWHTVMFTSTLKEWPKNHQTSLVLNSQKRHLGCGTLVTNVMIYIACYTLMKREKLKGIPVTFTTEGESYSNTEYC